MWRSLSVPLILSENDAGVLLEVGGLAVVSLPLTLLVAHDLVLELQLQLQQLNFFLVSFKLVLQVTDLSRAFAVERALPLQRDIFVHVAAVAQCQITAAAILG